MGWGSMRRSRNRTRTYKRQPTSNRDIRKGRSRLVEVERVESSSRTPKPKSNVTRKRGGNIETTNLSGRQAVKVANAKYDAKKAKYRQAGVAVTSSAASSASAVHDANEARKEEAIQSRKAREAEAAAATKIAEYKYGKSNDDSSLNPKPADTPEMLPNGTTTDPSEEAKKVVEPWAEIFEGWNS